MVEEFGIDFLSPLVMLFIPPITSVEASRSVVSTPQIISVVSNLAFQGSYPYMPQFHFYE